MYPFFYCFVFLLKYPVMIVSILQRISIFYFWIYYNFFFSLQWIIKHQHIFRYRSRLLDSFLFVFSAAMYIVWRLRQFTYIEYFTFIWWVGGCIFIFWTDFYRFELNLISVWGVVETDGGFGLIFLQTVRSPEQIEILAPTGHLSALHLTSPMNVHTFLTLNPTPTPTPPKLEGWTVDAWSSGCQRHIVPLFPAGRC